MRSMISLGWVMTSFDNACSSSPWVAIDFPVLFGGFGEQLGIGDGFGVGVAQDLYSVRRNARRGADGAAQAWRR